MLNENHSQIGKGQPRYQGYKIGEKYDWLGSHCNWSSFIMSFNIREGNFILLDKIPVSTIILPEDDFKCSTI